MKTDLLPPHSVEAEQGVLGCVLQDPKNSMLLCREVLPEASAFYDLRHQTIYGSFVAMEDQGTPIDLLTANTWLKSRSQLDRAGGLSYLAELPDRTPSAANLSHYLEIVAGNWARRRKIAALSEAILLLQDESRGVEETLDRVDSLVVGAGDSLNRSSIEPMAALVERAIESIERSYEHRNQGLLAGISTRFGYLDKLTGGIRSKELWFIGGRPGMGKTSWLCSLIIAIAVEQKIPFGFLSLEMSRDDIIMRLLCSLAFANSMHLRTGHLSRVDRDRLKAAAVRLASAPLFIDDAPSITPAQVRSKARRLIQGHGAQIVGLDHLHEIYVPEARGDERIQATEAGLALHFVAKTLGVPVIGLAQLSRTFESEAAKSRSRRPRMTDLRGSGNLEQKADLIGILWHNREDEREEEDLTSDEKSVPVSLEIVKQRNGPTGECQLTFFKSSLKYVDRYENTGSREGLERHREHQQQEAGELDTLA